MSAKLLTEHHLEFLCLKEGCTGSPEFTHVKMPHCWKSHVTTQINIWTSLWDFGPFGTWKNALFNNPWWCVPNFSLCLHLHTFLCIRAAKALSSLPTQLHRLAWAFIAQHCNKYQHQMGLRFWFILSVTGNIVRKYDQEIPQSQTADKPMAPRGRAIKQSRDTRKTN